MRAIMDKHVILQQIKRRLAEAHGDRLRGVILYGSFARGEETPDSDIDILALFEGPIRLTRDIEKNNRALIRLSIELDHPISTMPVDEERFHNYECPLFSIVKREGIAA